MEGVVGLQQGAGNLFLEETIAQGVDFIYRSGNNHLVGTVDRGKIQIIIQEWFDGFFPDGYGEHAALGHFRHQPAARGDQGKRVFQAEYAGQTGGDPFADTVSGHGHRFQSPRHPQTGKGVFKDEDRRLYQVGSRVGDAAEFGKQQVAVEVSSVIRASPDSFRIAWIERRYQDGSLADTARWSAILTVVVQAPRDADQLRANPLGIYVNAINWSKELAQ